MFILEGILVSSERVKPTTMQRHPLYEWLWENRFFTKLLKDGTEPTSSHHLMNGKYGGVLCVPGEKNAEFLAKYVDACHAGWDVYVSELRTPIFPFMVDLDILQPKLITKGALCQILQQLYTTSRKFFPGSQRDPSPVFDMLILTREPSQKDDMYKQGIHVIFPNLLVDGVEAVRIRDAVVANLSRLLPAHDWCKVVDAAIYKPSGGLRMPLSHKLVRCGSCKDQEAEKQVCATCRGKGKVKGGVGDMYQLWEYWSNGETCESKTDAMVNDYVLVKTASLRKFGESLTPGFEVYPGCPAPKDERDVVEVQTDDGVILEFAEDYEAKKRMKQKVPVIRGSPAWSEIQKFISCNAPSVYHEVVISGVTTNPKMSAYTVTLKGEGSSYCMNIQRSHKTNTVYFVVTKEGMVQKCFCRCDTLVGRRSGLCKNYKSHVFKISPQLHTALFDGAASKLGHLMHRRSLCNPTTAKDSHVSAVNHCLLQQAKLMQSLRNPTDDQKAKQSTYKKVRKAKDKESENANQKRSKK